MIAMQQGKIVRIWEGQPVCMQQGADSKEAVCPYFLACNTIFVSKFGFVKETKKYLIHGMSGKFLCSTMVVVLQVLKYC